jgi:hypothetical protein
MLNIPVAYSLTISGFIYAIVIGNVAGRYGASVCWAL